MNRSKKIEDLIDLVALLIKDSNTACPVVVLSEPEYVMLIVQREELSAHLSDYFWSFEEDSWERAQDLDYWTLEEMVEYYNEHKYGELRD
tara:strand:+ start:327 stop:596 length:270 start_codon:yes stop_codon:yes gene_type:complete